MTDTLSKNNDGFLSFFKAGTRFLVAEITLWTGWKGQKPHTSLLFALWLTLHVFPSQLRRNGWRPVGQPRNPAKKEIKHVSIK